MVQVRRLGSQIGAEIHGVDVRKLDDASFAEIYRAWLDNNVVVVPGQELEIDDFLTYSRRFGFVSPHPSKTTRLDDLVAALRAGEIAGAGLDVFEQEPLPADHPLWTMPGVLITPHTAGFGPYLDERRFEILLDNCRRLVAGQPLRNVVDKATWF